MAYPTDQILIFYLEATTEQQIDSVNAELGLVEIGLDPVSDRLRTVSQVGGGRDILETSRLVYESGLVEFAQPEMLETGGLCYTPNDPMFDEEWWLLNADSTHSIDADSAWEITTGSPDISIAFIDDGYELDHYDFLDSDYQPALEVFAKWDAAGFWLYDTLGDPVPDPPCDTSWAPCYHGTQTMGMVFAQMNNGRGLAGIAPNCQITPIKIFADEALDFEGFPHKSWDWVLAQKHILRLWRERKDNPTWPAVAVVSCQIVCCWDSQVIAYFDTLWSEGVFWVNAGHQGGGSGVESIAQLPTVTAVNEVNDYDIIDPLVGGHDSLDCVAPGIGVKAVDLSGTAGQNTAGDGDYYGPVSGASYAAPLVAGTAALVYSRRPDLMPDSAPPLAIRSVLYRSCEDTVGPGYWDLPGWDAHYGWGRINPYRALIAVTRGDVNNDGVHNVMDVVLTVCELYRDMPPQGLHPGQADANCDGEVTVLDLVRIIDTAFRGEPVPDACFIFEGYASQ